MLPLPAQVLLETLPGWPEVQEPTILESLTLLLFLPVGMALAFVLVIMAPAWRARDDRS